MPTAQTVKEAGNDAFRYGKYAEAVTCYTECMRLDPSESTYPLNRSMAYLKLHKYAEAERDASKSLALLPAGNPKALFRRGVARKGLGRLDDAQKDLDAALAEEPSNASVKAELKSLKSVQTARNLLPQLTPPATQVEVPKTSTQPSTTPGSAKPVKRLANGEASVGDTTSKDEKGRTARLKAAITPEGASHTPKVVSNGLFQEISTRRLSPKSGPANTSTTPPPSSPSKTPAAAATANISDFRTLRSQREERKNSSTPVYRPEKIEESSCTVDNTRERVLSTTPMQLPPSTVFEFERRWKNDDTLAARLSMLQAITKSTTSIPSFFGQNLEPEQLDNILQCLADSTANGERRDLAWQRELLNALPDCARFDFVAMMSSQLSLLPSLLDPSNPESARILRKWPS